MDEHEAQNKQTNDGVISRPRVAEVLARDEDGRDHRSEKAQNQGEVN
jgi:hypothetical protein